jgi:predicted Zn-dependent protease
MRAWAARSLESPSIMVAMGDDRGRSELIAEIGELLAANRADELRDMLGAHVREHPGDAFVRLYYGVALSLAADTREQAIVAIEAAVELEPSAPENLAIAASRMFLVGEFDRAEEYVRRATELVTLSEFVYGPLLTNVAGMLAAERGDDERARVLLAAAVAADPTDRSYAVDYAEFLIKHQDHAEARKVALAAVAHHPDDERLRGLSEQAGWFDAIRGVLSGDNGPFRCPVNDDGELVIDWATEPNGRTRLSCPSCEAEVFIEPSPK